MRDVPEHSPMVEWIADDIQRRAAADADFHAIVFTHFVGENDMMLDALRVRGIVVERLTGQDQEQQKSATISNFKSGNVTVLVANIKCGAVGLNFQVATVSYFLTADWNPCREIQAIARTHRKGQKRDVEAIVVVPMRQDGSYLDDNMQSTQAEKLYQLQHVDHNEYAHTARIAPDLLEKAAKAVQERSAKRQRAKR